MLSNRKSSRSRFCLTLLAVFLSCLGTARALYVPPASNPFITASGETVTTLNVTSGNIADAQTQLNNARSANPNAVIVLNLTGTYTVTNQALTLPSMTCVVLQSHAVIQADPAITAPALIQTTSQSLVSVAGGTLNGNGTNIVGILVTTCDRVEIDDVSIQDCGQDGIRLTGHGNTTFDNEMTVTRCTVFGCGGNGISASSSTQFVAIDNNCYDNTAAGLLIGGAHSSVAKNTCTANGTGISVTGTPNNAITDNEIDNNGTGIALASTSASNWCTSNNFNGNTVVAVGAAGTADIIFDNTFSSNAANLTATGSNNHIVARKGALSASGQDYFYPPLIDDQHTKTTIVNGMGRTDVTIGSTTMSSVQSQYNSARSAHPGNVIVLHLTGNYTGDATLNLSADTCVLLSGTITLNSGVTGFATSGSGANHISVSGGTVDGQNTTGRNALSFSACQMVQIDGMTLNNFGSDVNAVSGSDIIHFTAGTGAGAPYLVSRCTMNGSAGRAIWSQIQLQAVYTNNNNANTRAGIDLDSHTHNALVKFNTFTGSRYGLFIEQSDQFNQGIGNNCVNNTGRGINLMNNTEDVAMQYNSVICNVSNGNTTGVRCGSTGLTSSGTPSLALHNFMFGNQCFNNTGDGIESDPTGSQNLFSQTNLGGNGTAIVTSGSEVFFNPVPPPVIPQTYSIVANAGANGSISPSGTVVVDQGASQTFTITPNAGYSVSSVAVDGTNVGAVTSYTFTNVQTNHVITASFASTAATFTITASAGTGGTISPSGSVAVTQGTSQAFTIAANSGYAIASVTVDGANVGAVSSYTFSDVQANHTISAAFSAVTSTEINDTDVGIVYTGAWSYSSGRNHGDYQNDVHATKNNGDSVSYTFNGSGISYITETNTDEGNVSFYIDGVLQQTVSCVSSTRVAQQAVFTASGLASGSHTLKAVKVDGTYMLLDALIINTTVTPTFTITASAGTGGTISPSGSVTVAQGANQTFTITANSGEVISDVSIDGASAGAVSTYTFGNVQANHTIAASFSASTALPVGWTDVDVGAPAMAGNAMYSSGTFNVTGGGTDIWNTSDQFNYAYETTSGNMTVTALVASQQNTATWAKSGVMFRGSTAANDVFVDVFVSPSNGIAMQYRTAVGGTCTSIAGTTTVAAPYWVRIVRSGTTFTGYSSPDGTTWTQVGSATISMATSATAGLEVCSHTATALNTSTFQNVAITTTVADTNIAPSGTAYGWFGMTSSTATTNQTAKPGLNDNNLTTDVDLDSAGDAIGAWEAAGVIWSSAKTISSADFINGTVTTGGDGFLTANLTLQYTTNGTSWTNTGWTISPTYPYSSAASGQTYTASGTALSGVLGMRFVGQVRSTDTSYHWIVKEVQLTGH